MYVGARSRDGLDAGNPAFRAEESLQLQHVLRKRFGGHRVASEGAHRCLIGTRRPTQAKVDSARMECGQRAELLGDGEG